MMIIRRFQYNIDYTHILTFREEYKIPISSLFGFGKIRYGIENENTINENIKLFFEEENFALFVRKEGITFLYEGDIKNIKNQNGIFKFFWDLYDKIKAFNGYVKTNRHSIILHAVDITDIQKTKDIISKCPFLSKNPFGDLKDFGAIYEFQKSDKQYKFQFGTFSSERDIKTHDLSPFNTDFNKELIGNSGLMCKLELFEELNSPSFSKFKTLLTDAENIISLFTQSYYEEK